MAKHYSDRGWTGMQLDMDGMVFTVTEVYEGSPAAKARVRPGDLLVAINGVEYTEENQEKMIEIQAQMKPGAQFTYTLKRGGKRRNVDFVLVEMSFDVVATMIGTHLLKDHVDLDLAFNSESD
jgi:C-terminal processing protease CtpA/Prc